MINIIKSEFRNHKTVKNYLALIISTILILCTLKIFESYYLYNINIVYGSIKENRTYIVYNTDDNFIKELNSLIEIENIGNKSLSENPNDNNTYLILTIKKYEDTDNLIKYFKDKQIFYQLQDSTKIGNMQIYKDNIKIIQKIIIIIEISLFIIFYSIIKNIYYTSYNNLALLKVLGYSNIKVILINFINIISYIGISLFNIIIILILFKSLNFCIKLELIESFIEWLNIINIFNSISVIIILSAIINLIPYIFKIKNINIFEIDN